MMIITYESPALVDTRPRLLDIDDMNDSQYLEKLLDSIYLQIEHLHTGEEIIIKCVTRDDD